MYDMLYSIVLPLIFTKIKKMILQWKLGFLYFLSLWGPSSYAVWLLIKKVADLVLIKFLSLNQLWIYFAEISQASAINLQFTLVYFFSYPLLQWSYVPFAFYCSDQAHGIIEKSLHKCF